MKIYESLVQRHLAGIYVPHPHCIHQAASCLLDSSLEKRQQVNSLNPCGILYIPAYPLGLDSLRNVMIDHQRFVQTLRQPTVPTRLPPLASLLDRDQMARC